MNNLLDEENKISSVDTWTRSSCREGYQNMWTSSLPPFFSLSPDRLYPPFQIYLKGKVFETRQALTCVSLGKRRFIDSFHESKCGQMQNMAGDKEVI